MNSLRPLALVVALLMSTASPARTEGAQDSERRATTKVAILELSALSDGIGELKAKYNKLEAEMAPRRRELESFEDSLAKIDRVLMEQKNLAQQEALKLQEQLAEGKRSLQRMLEDFQATVVRREEEETGPIKARLSKFLEQYCQRQGIAFVFDGDKLQDKGVVIFADARTNITQDFIREYNKANPGQSGGTPSKLPLPGADSSVVRAFRPLSRR